MVRGLTRGRVLRSLAAACLAALIGSITQDTYAHSAVVERGLVWLRDQVGTGPTVTGESTSIAAVGQVRTEALAALQRFQSPAPALVDGLVTSSDAATEQLARRILVLGESGKSVLSLSALLRAQQNLDGGFGAALGYRSNALDTAWALMALRDVQSAAAADKAATYLLTAQNSDGGYAAPSGVSRVYVTSYVLMSLQPYRMLPVVAAASDKIQGWLSAQQNAGAYVDALHNALASSALALATSDTTRYNKALLALRAQQAADGSWQQDPYVTSLALRALGIADFSDPPGGASDSTLTGTAVDAATSAPLADVRIMSGGNLVHTSANGKFSFGPVAPGEHVLVFSKPGYVDRSVGLSTEAGVDVSLGLVTLQRVMDSAIVAGDVISAATGEGLPGVGVTVTQAGQPVGSDITDPSGHYEITGIPPGEIEILISIPGYQPVSIVTTVVAGTVYTLSPPMFAADEAPPVRAGVTGVVVSSQTDSPLAGAVVVLRGASLAADLAGSFAVDDLEPGAFILEVRADGYEALSVTGVLSAGTNQIGTIRLHPVSSEVAVGGIVTEEGTGKPIGGVAVSVAGADVRAITGPSGHYQLTGLAAGSLTLEASAPGYLSKRIQVGVTAPGQFTVDFPLERNEPFGVALSVETNLGEYDPYFEVKITGQAQNNTAEEVQLSFTAAILDRDQRQLAEFPALPFLQRSPIPESLPVPANGTLDVLTEWYNLNAPPGQYMVVLRARNLRGVVVAEAAAPFTLRPQASVGGNISLDPPIVQAGTLQAVSITASVANQGNVTLPAGPVSAEVVLEAVDSTLPEKTFAEARVLWAGAPLLSPKAAVYDQAGNLYVANADRKLLRRTPAGVVSLLATLPNIPVDMVMSAAGNLYVLLSNSTFAIVTPSGGIQTKPTGFVGAVASIDVDQTGNVYVSGSNSGQAELARVSPQGTRTVLVRNGLASPTDAARGIDGALYVTNFNDDTISRIDPSGRITPFVTTGLSRPRGIALGPDGFLYVISSGTNSVVRVDGAGVVTTFASGLSDPQFLAFDAAGSLLVTNAGTDTIARVDRQGSVTVFARSAANRPAGIDYDSKGNLFVANTDGTITHIGVDDEVSVLTASLSLSARDLEIGYDGKAYVATGTSNGISRLNGGVLEAVATGLAVPHGLAFDPSGTLYFTEQGAGRVSRLLPGGGRETVLRSFLSAPRELVKDSGGNIFIVNAGSIALVKPGLTGDILIASTASIGTITAAAPAPSGGLLLLVGANKLVRVSIDGAISTLATLGGSMSDLITDAAGNLYVRDTAQTRIYKLDAGYQQSLHATLPSVAVAMAPGTDGIYASLASGSIARVTPAGVVQTLVTGLNTPDALQPVEDGTVYVITNGSSRLTRVTAGGAASTVLTGLVHARAIITLGPELLIAEFSTDRLTRLTRGGVVVERITGFGTLGDIEWFHDRFVFADGSRIVSFVPGGNPLLLASLNGPGYLDGRGPSLLVGNGTNLTEVQTDGSTRVFASPPASNALSGVTRSTQGKIAAADEVDSSVTVLDISGQATAGYMGLLDPAGIVVADDGEIFVANTRGSTIVRIRPDGRQATLFATVPSPSGLEALPDGSFLVATSVALQKISAEGIRSVAVLHAGLSKAVQTPEGTFVIDRASDAILRLVGSELSTFASGINPDSLVRLDAAGAAIVLNSGRNTILKHEGGALSTLRSDLKNPTELEVTPSGELIVASLYSVEALNPNGTTTDYRIGIGDRSLIYSSGLSGIAVAPDQSLTVVGTQDNVLLRVVPGVDITPPAIGSVMYRGTATVGTLAAGEVAAPLDFGKWVPSVAGDYKVRVRSLNGIAGELVAMLHVGPHARATLQVAQQQVPAGDAKVTVSGFIEGANLTSIAKPDHTRLRDAGLLPGRPQALGADMAGNIYYGDTASVSRIAPDGTRTVVYAGAVSNFGTLPVDRAHNLYILTSSGQILRVGQGGVTTLIATLPADTPVGLVIDSHDRLFAATNKRLYRVVGNAVEAIASPLISHGIYGLTIDGHDNLYTIGRTSHVLRIAPDGTTQMVSGGEPKFEIEGMSIAGDCNDNLLAAASSWSELGQTGEEFTIGQFIGRTGRVGLALNGRGTTPSLDDIDHLVYDRYSGSLLIVKDINQTSFKAIQLPIRCGSISASLQLTLPRGQPAGGFSVPPSATVVLPSGETQLVWSLTDVTNLGTGIAFDTTLPGMKVGDQRPVASEAFLIFKNSFADSDVRVAVPVPKVEARGSIDLAITTDSATYALPADVLTTLTIANLSDGPVSGEVEARFVDANGRDVTTVLHQPAVLDGLGSATLTTAANTGQLVPGEYMIVASFTDDTGLLQDSASAVVTLSATSAHSLASTVSTDHRRYSPEATVQIDARLQNQSTSFVFKDLVSTVTIAGQQGVVYTGYVTATELRAQGTVDQNLSTELVHAAPGLYEVELVVTDALGRTVSTTKTEFEVVENLLSAIAGSVTVSPRRADAGSVVSCTDVITNQRGYHFGAVPLRRTTLRLADGAVINAEETQPALGSHGSVQFTRALATSGWAAGDYACALELGDAGTWHTLGHASFSLSPSPYRIEGITSPGSIEVVRGAVQSCTDTLVNTGGSTAQNLEFRQVVTSAAGQVFREQWHSLTLTPGTQQTLASAFATGELTAGPYYCAIEVRQGGEWRPVSRAVFEVKPVPAQIEGQVQVAQASVIRGEPQACTDTVRNTGDLGADTLIRRTLSLAGGATLRTDEQPLVLAGGAQQSLAREIATTELSAGDYVCGLEVKEGDTWRSLGSASFTVEPVPARVVGAVSVAATEVEYASSQTCTDQVDNTGDLTAPGVVLRRSLVDATGARLRSEEQTLDVAPNTPQSLTRTLDLTGLAAGAYSCVLEVQQQQSWTELGRAGFEIKPAPAKVEGTTSVQSAEVQRGTAQTCTDVLTNSGGAPAVNAVIRQRLARDGSDETLQTQQQTLDLNAGATMSLSRTYGTADLAAGTYVCALELQEADQWKPLSRATFAVTPIPARIEGQTRVQVAQLERGATQTCTDTVTNTGDVTATDAIVRQLVAPAAGGSAIITNEQTLTVAGGTSHSLSREFVTTELSAGDYACALEIKEDDAWRGLSRAVFTVLPVPATLVGSVAVAATEVDFAGSQTCTDTVSNTGDLAAAGITLRRTLLSDADGTALRTEDLTLDIGAGETPSLARDLSMAGIAAGGYACVLEVKDGEAWRFLGRGSFTVKPEPARVEGITQAEHAALTRGTPQSCTDDLVNRGGLPAENAVIRQALVQASDGAVLQSQKLVFTLAAGAAQTFTRSYATTDLAAGSYACSLELQSGEEWKPLSRAAFEVKPVPAQVEGQVQVAQASVIRGEPQACTDTVRNTGDLGADTLIRRTLSLAGGATLRTDEQPLVLAGGAQQSLAREIATTELSAGDYACGLEVKEGDIWRSLGSASFTVEPVPARVVGAVSVAAAEIEYASSQTCTDQVDNTGDLTAPGVVLRRSLVDATGARLRSEEQTLDVAPNTPQNLSRTLDLAGLAAGAYSCVLEIQQQQSWTELGRAGFTIKPAPAKVEGTTSVQSAEVQRGTAQTCTDVLTNSGGVPALNAVIRQRLARDGSDETLQTQQQTLDLNPGATQSLSRTYGTADLAAGTYVCALELQNADQWKPLSRASFTVTPVPARIEGQTRVQVGELEQGATQTCTDSIRNVGDVTATGVVVRQSILQTATSNLLQVREQTLDVPHEPEQQLIRVFSTQALAVGEYACQLDVRKDNHWQLLGQASFRVLEPAVKVSASLDVGSQGRVLVLTDEPVTDQDINERMFLDGLLESLGWSFTVDTNALSFTEDLRSGEYSIYALLQGKEKLAETVQKELREAIFRGEGLVEAGSHDQRNSNVDSALGIKSNGKHSSVTGVYLPSTPLYAGGTLELQRTGQNLRAEPQGAQTAGIYTGVSGVAPAITTNAFGGGKSVYTGFDLLLEGAHEGTTGQHADLFGKALAYVAPPSMPLATSGVVPLRLKLSSQGVATSLRVALPIPASVTLVDRGAAQIDSNGGLVWTLNLAAGEERLLQAWVRLPDAPGRVRFDATVQVKRGSTYVDHATAAFEAQTAERPDFDEARALSMTDTAFKQVRQWLDKTAVSIAQGDYTRALTELTKAADEAAKVGTHPRLSELRMAIGEAIRDVGKRL